MYEKIIKNYIENKFTKNDIINFGYNENISLTQEEVNFLYYNIKNHWKDFLNDDTFYLKMLKDNLRPDVYNKAIEIYDKYKYYKKYI